MRRDRHCEVKYAKSSHPLTTNFTFRNSKFINSFIMGLFMESWCKLHVHARLQQLIINCSDYVDAEDGTHARARVQAALLPWRGFHCYCATVICAAVSAKCQAGDHPSCVYASLPEREGNE
jgi:hypothetical protein